MNIGILLLIYGIYTMPSLRNSQTLEGFIDTIRLSLRHPIGNQRYWVLVEGITDQKLYQKLIDGEKTHVKAVPQGGIAKLRLVLSTLLSESTESLQPATHVLGIRDADFLHLDGQQELQENLFITDVHDAEMMIIACNETFQSWISEYLPEELNNFKQLREQFLHSLIFLGGLRWLNDGEDLGLNFEDFYHETYSNLDKQVCIDKLEKRSPQRKRSVSTEEIDKLVIDVTDYYQLCNGHDMENVMARWVSKQYKGIKPEQVGAALRVAYRKQDFIATQLYQNLTHWQKQHGAILFAEHSI